MGNDKNAKSDHEEILEQRGSKRNSQEKREISETLEQRGSKRNSQEKREISEALEQRGSNRNTQEKREFSETLEQSGGKRDTPERKEHVESHDQKGISKSTSEHGETLKDEASSRNSPIKGSSRNSPSWGNSKGSSRSSPEPDYDKDKQKPHHKDIKSLLQKSWHAVSKKHFSREQNGKGRNQDEESTMTSYEPIQDAESHDEPEVKQESEETFNEESASKEAKVHSRKPRSRSRSPSPAPESPPRSWAFTAKASMIPSKFDHIAALKAAYASHKETVGGKEGIPLSMLPEVLESARFMVPPPRELVPLLQRIDILYKAGDLVRWTLLQNLAFQIERREARYPSVFSTRVAPGRISGVSPNSWRSTRSPSRRTHPEDDCPELEPEVYEMMKEIDNHRKKFVSEGNYLAAEDAATRLMELKLFEDNKRRAIMLERHTQEREQVERAYKDDLDERNQLWDERLKSFQKEVVEHAQRLKQQHVVALEQFKEKLHSKPNLKAQWSRELLKQRRIQACLGKQGKYLEAQDVKENADRMEQIELQAAIAARHAELISKEQGFRLKQQAEMDILLQRAARTREEIRKSRASDLQRIHQRHKNVIQELTAAQKQELYRFDQLMQKKAKNQYAGHGHRHHHSTRYSQGYDYSSDSCGSDDNMS